MDYLPDSIPEPLIPSGVGEGWWPLIEKLHADILEIDPDYQIDQIKEKFGGLRYYITFSNNLNEHKISEIMLLINDAEKKSFTICEVCGKEGKLRTGEDIHWIYTACDEHGKGTKREAFGI